MMLRIVRFDQHAQRFDKAVTRVPRVVANLVNQLVELIDGRVVFARAVNREERSECVRVLSGFE